MSNQLCLEYTRFEDLDVLGNAQTESYGYRAYDQYASVYYNLCNTFDELVELVNEQNVIGYLCQNHYDEFDDTSLRKGVLTNGIFIEPPVCPSCKDNKDLVADEDGIYCTSCACADEPTLGVVSSKHFEAMPADHYRSV